MPIIFIGFKMRSFLWGFLVAVALMVALVEMMHFDWIVGWFSAINITTFFFMGRDKLAAKSGRRRTPETALLGMAFAGGFPGLFAGRKLFQHKTSKASFVTSMWLLFFLQLGIVAYFIGNITTLDQLLTSIGLEKKADISAE